MAVVMICADCDAETDVEIERRCSVIRWTCQACGLEQEIGFDEAGIGD